MITLCGQILVSRIGDDSLPFPCVHSKRPGVYVQNVSVYAGNTRTCVSTCARGGWHTRDVLNVHAEMRFVDTRCFSACTPNAHTHHDHNHSHNDTHHRHHHRHHMCIPTHNITHNTTRNITRRQRDRERERQSKKTETERERQRRRQERREKMEEKINLCLLNRVKHDSSLISFSASWPVNSFLISANCLIHAVSVSKFSELFSCAATFFFLPALILRKFPVEG